MADVNNGDNIIPKKCIDTSNKFIRAIDKYGVMINLMVLQTTEPKNQYELLYGQAETSVAEDLQFKALLIMNPPEDKYKDMHMEVRGDAMLELMSYSMQKVGLIGNTLLEYLKVPKLLMGNHIRVGDDYYRIDEVRQDAVFMGFPLHMMCVLTFIETKHEEPNAEGGEVDGELSTDIHGEEQL